MICAISVGNGEELWTCDLKGVDEDKPLGTVIRHSCTAFADIRKVGRRHKVVACRLCNYRLVFPDFIESWLELATWIRDQS